MRARITLRKRGAEITDENLAAEVVNIRANKASAITYVDVIRAFEAGEEVRDRVASSAPSMKLMRGM